MVEELFVQIRDHTDIRRSILGSSKQIIQVLQRYERIKELRVKKIEKVEKLRKQNKEIRLLITKLKKEFPAAKLRVSIGKEERRVKDRGPHAGDELVKLETDLRMIEDKMGRLS